MVCGYDDSNPQFRVFRVRLTFNDPGTLGRFLLVATSARHQDHPASGGATERQHQDGRKNICEKSP